ncbi:hypothetical protein AI29_10725 [bacteria symbiont BFo2 of Frankliniella occidentalis]|nr:hypothetical protein AI29_10725 [bacteria symbiont BFo2 of Frankliniella occidentalis]KYP86898.1 hypothetical protein WB60_13320 [bacteria symbiont BFo2 of Frankliniella occidentalis]KYP92981.1 hypothetical protein WB67_15145 [bacteria symbiont BFo2 of Frankliniella occidentalis]
MPFSVSKLQKSSDISDGKDSFKGGLFITISYDGLLDRFKSFRTFFTAAISALAYKSTTICFYNVDAANALNKMSKQPHSKDRADASDN